MRWRPTTSWSRFPPRTRQVRFDEEWAFVARKEAPCDRDDPADDHTGDYWDHIAFDPEHRPVVAVVPGARDVENTEASVTEFGRRTGDRTMGLMTRDSYPASETAILAAYGEAVTPPRTGKPGRPEAPDTVPRAGLTSATVEKRREEGRGVEIITRAVFGTMAAVAAALARSGAGRAIDTSFVERHDGTDRRHDARKSRRTYRFSKDWRDHEAVTYFTMYRSNFCWPVRTLRQSTEDGRWQRQTPAMAAGLTDHVWSLSEWIRLPVVLRS